MTVTISISTVTISTTIINILIIISRSISTTTSKAGDRPAREIFLNQDSNNKLFKPGLNNLLCKNKNTLSTF